MVDVLTAVAAVGTGLMAGLFFVFSVVMMPALDRLPAAQAVAVMQQVNRTIVRPLFLLIFVGTAVVGVALVVVALFSGGVLGIVGAALYVVGTFAVTAVVNVPLNNTLDAAREDEADAAWKAYAPRWTAWNHVRTVTSTGASVVLTLALAI